MAFIKFYVFFFIKIFILIHSFIRNRFGRRQKFFLILWYYWNRYFWIGFILTKKILQNTSKNCFFFFILTCVWHERLFSDSEIFLLIVTWEDELEVELLKFGLLYGLNREAFNLSDIIEGTREGLPRRLAYAVRKGFGGMFLWCCCCWTARASWADKNIGLNPNDPKVLFDAEDESNYFSGSHHW